MAAFFAAHRLDALLVLLGVAAGAATLAGGALALRLAQKVHLILGFSAGAVLGVALFDLLTEAIDLGASAHPADVIIAVTAFGFMAYLVADRSLVMFSKDRPGHRGHLGAGSLTLHSALDGLAIGLGFQVSASVGAILTLAVLAHDFSDGINTVNLSLAGAGSPRIARRWLVADAVAPLSGIVASRFIVAPRKDLALIIALFAGFFLYIGASELLPDSHQRHPSVWTMISTLLGVVLIFAVVRLAPWIASR